MSLLRNAYRSHRQQAPLIRGSPRKSAFSVELDKANGCNGARPRTRAHVLRLAQLRTVAQR